MELSTSTGPGDQRIAGGNRKVRHGGARIKRRGVRDRPEAASPLRAAPVCMRFHVGATCRGARMFRRPASRVCCSTAPGLVRAPQLECDCADRGADRRNRGPVGMVSQRVGGCEPHEVLWGEDGRSMGIRGPLCAGAARGVGTATRSGTVRGDAQQTRTSAQGASSMRGGRRRRCLLSGPRSGAALFCPAARAGKRRLHMSRWVSDVPIQSAPVWGPTPPQEVAVRGRLAEARACPLCSRRRLGGECSAKLVGRRQHFGVGRGHRAVLRRHVGHIGRSCHNFGARRIRRGGSFLSTCGEQFFRKSRVS